MPFRWRRARLNDFGPSRPSPLDHPGDASPDFLPGRTRSRASTPLGPGSEVCSESAKDSLAMAQALRQHVEIAAKLDDLSRLDARPACRADLPRDGLDPLRRTPERGGIAKTLRSLSDFAGESFERAGGFVRHRRNLRSAL
jgi:hypothetical protein